MGIIACVGRCEAGQMGDITTFASIWISTWDLQIALVVASSFLMAFVAPPGGAIPNIPTQSDGPQHAAVAVPRSHPLTTAEQWDRVHNIAAASLVRADVITKRHQAAAIELASAERTLAALRSEMAALTKSSVRALAPVSPVLIKNRSPVQPALAA